MVNVIILPALYAAERRTVIDAALLIDGRLKRANGAVNLVADRLTTLHVATRSRSRDFQ